MNSPNHLKFGLRLACLLGICPSHLVTPRLRPFYRLYQKTTISYFFAFVATQFVQLYYIELDDFEELLENTGVSLLYVIGIFKTFSCMNGQAIRLIDQIAEVEKEVYREGGSIKHKEMYENHVQRNNSVSLFFTWVTIITISMFWVYPGISEYIASMDYQALNGTEYRVRALPFSSWFPFDKYKHYYLAYLLQVLAGFFGAGFVMVSDLFLFGLMVFCLGQVRIMADMFRYFKEKAGNFSEIEPQEGAILKTLRECVTRHQMIIQYATDMDKFMKMMMLMDFAICSMQIAVIAFQVIVAGLSVRQFLALEYLIAMLIQLLLYYWHANEIILESYGISQAIWESQWYDCSPTVKKNLHIIMMRSNKPLRLSVGPFYVMSTQTVITILKASYSYVALMRQSFIRKQGL